MTELINKILSDPAQSLLVVLNLIVIESLLAIDNAAVLASMVLGLSKEQRAKRSDMAFWEPMYLEACACCLLPF